MNSQPENRKKISKPPQKSPQFLLLLFLGLVAGSVVVVLNPNLQKKIDGWMTDKTVLEEKIAKEIFANPNTPKEFFEISKIKVIVDSQINARPEEIEELKKSLLKNNRPNGKHILEIQLISKIAVFSVLDWKNTMIQLSLFNEESKNKIWESTYEFKP